MTSLERIHKLLDSSTNMKLGKKQELFSVMHMNLLRFLHANGYGIRQKHLYRCQECRVGKKNSLHKSSLAIDIVLTKNNVLFTKSKDYLIAGEYWESLGGSWGGRFSESSPGAGDGNDGGHFSLTHQGMK